MSALTANSQTGASLFKRLTSSIRNKLIFGLAILLAIAFIVGVTAVVSQFQQINQIRQTVDVDVRLSQAQSQLLQSLSQLRWAERQFVLSKDELGISAAKSLYLEPWEDEVETIDGLFAEIRSIRGDDGMSSLENEVDAYKVAYQDTIDLLSTLGANGSGLQGDYERRLVALENAVEEANDPLMQIAFEWMQRSELEFLLTRNFKFIQDANERGDVILARADENTALDPATRQEIGRRLEEHRDSLSGIASISADINQATATHQEALQIAEQTLETQLESALVGASLAKAEVDALVNRGTLTILALTAVSVVSGIVIARLLSDRLTAQSEELLTFFDALDDEQVRARANVVSSDELGLVAQTLNQVLDERGGLIQTTGARNQIEASINNLITEMQDAAAGDLTTSAHVSSDITGAIADSFNFMIEQLRQVIQQAQGASLQLSSSANEIQTTAEYLADGSESQVEQILDTTSAVDEMSISIQQVSQNAALSATIGEQARSTASQGAHAVQEMVETLGDMHADIDNTADLVSQLSTDADELSDIVQLINAITERTSVLALNAAIQASARNKQGLGFNAVADQVESLAEQSSNATAEIDNLIRIVQQEALAANEAVLNTQAEVRSGLSLANEAGQRLHEIEQVSVKLTDLITSISQAAQQQARGSESIARSMNEIAGISQTTAANTRSATVSLEQLAQMADNLRQSMGRFKLN